MNDVYPLATLQLLDPETRTEPQIEGKALIFHRHGTAATSQAIGRYFGRRDVLVESTFSCARDGRMYEFQYLDRQADAQAAANGFAWSVESEDFAEASERWTQAQIESMGQLAAWLHLHKGLPLRMMDRPDGGGLGGLGWHSQYPSWNPNHHDCPGHVRALQVEREVLPAARWLAAVAASQQGRTAIVDKLATPDGRGLWNLQRDGGVITGGAAPFYGSYPGLPATVRNDPNRLFARILPYQGGYALRSTAGELYHFPPR